MNYRKVNHEPLHVVGCPGINNNNFRKIGSVNHKEPPNLYTGSCCESTINFGKQI